MESCIIRFYRRDAMDPDIASGLVESSFMGKPV